MINIARRSVDSADTLFFDGIDSGDLLEHTNERPPAPPSPPSSNPSRRLPKTSRNTPAPPAAPKYAHAALFRHLKAAEKLTSRGADPITEIHCENPVSDLEPTSIESVRFVARPLAPPVVKNLPGGKGPVESRRYCAARRPSLVLVEPPCSQRVETPVTLSFQESVQPPRSRVEALTSARLTTSHRRISYLKSLPANKTPRGFPIRKEPRTEDGNRAPPPVPLMSSRTPGWLEQSEKSRPTTADLLSTESQWRIKSKAKNRDSPTWSEDTEAPADQESKIDPRPTPVIPTIVTVKSPKTSAKVTTESPNSLLGQAEVWKRRFRLFLKVLMSTAYHILLNFSRLPPAWRTLQKSKVGRDEFMDAWCTVWLAMVYLVALWGVSTTAGKFVCFMAERVNWVLRIASLFMVSGIFSRCCSSNG